jgi:putrescine aminotransferase
MNDRTTHDWQHADNAHYLHPFTDYQALHARGAMVVVRGSGCYVWDSDGNRYLDGLAGLACVQVGYGRAELADAASRQIRELSYFNSFFKATNPRAVELAERLVALAPAGFGHVFFVNSGSEANDTCIRMVRHYWALEGRPERTVIIAREAGYHGSTIAAASLSGMAPMHEQAARLPDFAHIPAPYQFALGRGLSAEAFARAASGWLEEKILEIGPGRVAAFVAEPLQGAGGAKMPPPGYWAEIRRICRKYDVLLVIDEVVCGFGRTGAWFGSQTYGIEGADLMCVAKGITSGYIPLAAVLVGDRIADALIGKGGEFHHGFTYSGHPVACAVALANLDIIARERLVERVRDEIGPHFAAGLASLAGHPLVGEVRSCGLVGAVELVADRATLSPLEPAGEAGERFRDHGLRHGIITRPVGETIVLMPPLVISAAEVDTLVGAFGGALDDYAAERATHALRSADRPPEQSSRAGD